MISPQEDHPRLGGSSARLGVTRLAPYAPEFSEWFSRFRFSCFRLETLPSYGGSGEDSSLAAFLAGGNPPPDAERRDWTRQVQAAAQHGRSMSRVHVVTEPLTDYLRFEIGWSYPQSVAAGEDVRILPLVDTGQWPTDVLREDFWLFDSSVLFVMVYDADGMWRGIEWVTDPTRVVTACRARDAALHLSQPWAEFTRARPALRAPAASE